MTLQKVQRKPSFVVKTDLGKNADKEEHTPESPLEENVPEEVNDYKKVVYCNFTECAYNTQIDGLVHKETTIKKDGWRPMFKEKVWDSVCAREEVIIQDGKGVGGQRRPACFTPWGKTGHQDMSKMMPEMFNIPDPPGYRDAYESGAFGEGTGGDIQVG